MAVRRPRTKAAAATAAKEVIAEEAPKAPAAETAAPEPVVTQIEEKSEEVRTEEAPAGPAVAPQEAKAGPAEAKAKEPAPNATGSGWICIRGQEFRYDVVILPDGTVRKRDAQVSKKKKEKYGHVPLTLKELSALVSDDVELIVIGTGQDGCMPITPKAQELLESRPSFIGPTPYALDWMEKDGRRCVAVLHVSC
jgi:hypothetical protein